MRQLKQSEPVDGGRILSKPKYQNQKLNFLAEFETAKLLKSTHTQNSLHKTSYNTAEKAADKKKRWRFCWRIFRKAEDALTVIQVSQIRFEDEFIFSVARGYFVQRVLHILINSMAHITICNLQNLTYQMIEIIAGSMLIWNRYVLAIMSRVLRARTTFSRSRKLKHDK